MSQDYQSSLDQIDAALKEGKPRTALTAAEQYYELASQANDEDQMIKALGYRAGLVNQLEEDGNEAALQLLHEQLAANARRPVVAAVLNYLIGKTYYDYARNNSYRLRNNTAVTTDTLPGAATPLAEWNLTQLTAAAEQHLYRSLAISRAGRTRLAEIPAIITNPTARAAERPTLYDLLARAAMDMLSNPLLSVGDADVSQPEQYLVDAAAFVAIPLPMDTTSGVYRKLRLYQQLINFHLGPPSEALLAVDRERIEYVFGLGTDVADDMAALRRMQATYAGVPGRQALLVREARLYAFSNPADSLSQTPKAIALAMLDRITDTAAVVARPAEELRRQLLTKELNVTVSTTYPSGGSLLFSVQYRNTARVYHRLYPAPADDPDEKLQGWNTDEKALAALVARTPLASQDFQLPANDDYEDHVTETWLATPPNGRYYLVSSDHPDFDFEKGLVSITNFQVTDLAVQRLEGEDAYLYEVIDRTTGAARRGLKVQVQSNGQYGQGRWKTKQTLTTGADGRFEPDSGGSFRFIVTDPQGNDRLVTSSTYDYYGRGEYDPNPDYTPLFTDRHLYRPGQRVHVYGLTWKYTEDRMPMMRTGVTRQLELVDANYQVVTTVEATSDEMSRFHTSFRLPAGGLTGSFRIRTQGGEIEFQVEEYKRPRFTVELETPDYVVATEEATVTGTAKLFAGPAVNDAKVNYRVFLEEVSYYWWRGGGGNARELVADGTTRTDDAGIFSLTFTPESRSSQGRKRYRYVVEADVTDETGETHDATTSVGLRSEKPVVALSTPTELIDVQDSLLIMAAGAEEDVIVSVRITPVDKPGTALQNREWSFPDRPVITEAEYQKRFPTLAARQTPDLTEWPTTGPATYTGQLTLTQGEGRIKLPARKWPVGHYRIDWTYPDGTAGEPATFAVLNEKKAQLPAGYLAHLAVSNNNPKVGEQVTVMLITAVDVPNIDGNWGSRRGERDVSTSAKRSVEFTYTPTEADRGGFQLNVGFPRFGDVHSFQERFQLGWDNKKLKIDYATFRDKLRPGAAERWELKIRNADGTPVMAAAVAAMYDASLDDILPGRAWSFDPFPSYYGAPRRAQLMTTGSDQGYGQTNVRSADLPDIPSLPELNLYVGAALNMRGRNMQKRMRSSAPAAYEVAEEESLEFLDNSETSAAPAAMAGAAPPPPPPMPVSEDAADDAEQPPVQIRKKLQETALWQPDLTSDADGNLVIAFDSPEALTTWKFRLFAHDQQLASAISEQTVVTQKELMVLPNVPRFVREGDRITLTARVNNLTDAAMAVTTTLELFDPQTDEAFGTDVLKSLGADAGAKGWKKEQNVGPQSGESVSFDLTVPDGFSERGPIGYRVIARAAGFSDGEENVIPVLTDRTLVTVSQPFYLKKNQEKTVSLPILTQQNSATHRPVSYTFQAVTNPAWLALKALPYLMEYPYECSEQLANRYFANQLAFATVSRKPVLEQVFRAWQKDSNALLSELEQNATLKNALLTETPWVRAAQDETAQRARIGELFDLKRLAEEQTEALTKLAQRQTDNGYFPWFPGGRENRYITQYVLETTGRLTQLGAITPDQEQRVTEMQRRAVIYLDQSYEREYQGLVRQMKRDNEPNWRDTYRPSSSVIHYLYARTMARTDVGLATQNRAGYDFFLERSLKNWLSYGLYEQALIAATNAEMKRQWYDKSGLPPGATPAKQTLAGKEIGAYATLIVESLRERAIRKDEFGMYWKYDRGYRWQNLPIETHCRILEAFQTAGGTTDELDEMRLWLLTNKRTSRWPTTKSTAAAVFALLNTGSNWTDAPGENIEVNYPQRAQVSTAFASRVRAAQNDAEAATGAFSVSAGVREISQELGSVKVSNPTNRLVWGGVFYQYTEVAARVEQSNDGPLRLSRALYRRVATDQGVRLEPITADAPLSPGDRVTVKLTVTTDRDLDFVHLKDRRAATFEPIDQLSGYDYTNGLGYYYAPGDLATNFFIDRLPRGTFVLEYDLFATYEGSFSNGLGRVQCMYAPEFGGNTEGARIVVE